MDFHISIAVTQPFYQLHLGMYSFGIGIDGLMMEVVADILMPSPQPPTPVVKGGIVRSQKAPGQADKFILTPRGVGHFRGVEFILYSGGERMKPRKWTAEEKMAMVLERTCR